MKKAVVLTLILVSLMALGVVCIQLIKAEYQGNITINADGSISPSTAPIQQTGDTYSLTGDVVGSISVMRSNMTFDGNGYLLIGGKGVGGLSVGGNPYSSPPVATGATNVTVKNLTVKESVFGISLVDTLNALIFNNTILETRNVPFHSTAGIYVEGGGSNIIAGNNLVNNYDGMSFIETRNNLIVGNNITNCRNPGSPNISSYALMFWGASNNTIYHNSFVDNAAQALNAAADSPSSINIWDDGYPSGGNYWSDYLTRYPGATEIDSSGIGNMPYVVDANNTDRYPLMEPFTTTPPKISVLSPLNQTYNESSVPLIFTADKTVNWTGYSLDGKQNATITGNYTVTNIPNGLHSITVYANDTFGNIGTSTISFTISKPEPFPTTLVIVTSVAVVAVVGVSLLVYFKKRKR